jgi:hypothetical protein
LARDVAALWRDTVDLTSAAHHKIITLELFLQMLRKQPAEEDGVRTKERLGRQAIHRVPATDKKRTPGESISLCIP